MNFEPMKQRTLAEAKAELASEDAARQESISKARELQVPADQYDTRREMYYASELSGNWIYQDDPSMDDEMRAVVQIHEGSPLINPDGSWNEQKLVQLARTLLQMAQHRPLAHYDPPLPELPSKIRNRKEWEAAHPGVDYNELG